MEKTSNLKNAETAMENASIIEMTMSILERTKLGYPTFWFTHCHQYYSILQEVNELKEACRQKTELSVKEEVKLYTISEAAEMLHITTKQLNNLIAEGRIAVHQVGKRRKISMQEIKKFINEDKIYAKVLVDSSSAYQYSSDIPFDQIFETIFYNKMEDGNE